MRNRGVPQRSLARTPGTSEVPGMHPRYLHKGAQLISGKATHGMPCKIGQNALWYMRVMVFWYKCEICDFTFWPDGDRTFRAHKQNSPRRCRTRSFSTLLAFTACLMAPKENITAYDGHHESWKVQKCREGRRRILDFGLSTVVLEYSA